jgi:two-component system CheB/CheR fusion protein
LAPAAPSKSTAVTPEWPDFPVVGVGASAGGLEAFSQILAVLAPDSGVAIVFVQHLSPNRDSMLAELLGNQSSIPVVQISDGMPIEPNHVYVTPPNVQLDILNGQLRLVPRPSDLSQHTPVDHFFHSLAEAAQGHAIGVVLSGTASDGASGLKEIKAVGGIAIAQTPESAKFSGMPSAAIATGAVDLTLTPKDIALELARISHHPFVRRIVPRQEGDDIPILDNELQRIFAMLRAASGVDFTHYKLPTIKRRLQRRMVLHKITSIDQYLKYLQRFPNEVSALYRDLLIHVTRFFREPESFKALMMVVIPALLANRQGAEDSIRIWTPGCATGEEPYSIAMLLLEALGDSTSNTPIQVFATDIADTAIEHARAGVYPESIASDVSPERLRRFFVRVDGSYRISKTVRDLCVFARQDLARDAPFSRIDLIVCRNVLIYLSVALQKRLMTVFHYALKPNGFLMLGAAETVGSNADLFAPADKHHPIYNRKDGPIRADMNLALAGYGLREDRSQSAAARHGGATVQSEANRIILDRYSPPAVLVDQDLQIIYFRGQTGPYLEPAQGEATLNVLKMVREGLLYPLRTALAEARRSGTSVRREDLRLKHQGELHQVSLEVIPVEGSIGGQHFLILFHEPPRKTAVQALKRERPARGERNRERDGRLAQLEQELAASREYLQSIIQDLEAANEELQSANEEILSSNEELQSTNEELDTAKEELQSTNEELNTLNEELHSRNEELSRSNSDLLNLLGSVQVAIVMVTNDLRIRRFTPMAEKVLNLIPTDVGRRITDIKPNIDCPDLERLISESVDSMVTVEREVHDRQGGAYTLRIRPYKSLENRIDGAILVLFEVDASRRGDLSQQYPSAALESLIDGLDSPLVMLDPELRVKFVNQAFLSAHALKRESAVGHLLYELDGSRWDNKSLRAVLNDSWSSQSPARNVRLRLDPQGDGAGALRLNARPIPSHDGRSGVLLVRLEEESTSS